MVARENLYTTAEFLDISQRPENADKHLELFQGMIIEMPPSSPSNGMIAMLIGHLLLTHILPKNLGYVTGPDVGYEVRPNTVFQPDVAFISKTRAGSIPQKVFPTAPDLAVEVISPSETLRSILDKVRLYLAAGASLVWAVDPENRKVDVYRLADNGELRVHTLGIGDILDAGEVLPGFIVNIEELFAVLDK